MINAKSAFRRCNEPAVLHDPLLTADFSLRTGSLRSDNLWLHNQVSSLRDCTATQQALVRRLKPTVNQISSLRDYLAAQSAAKSCKRCNEPAVIDDPLLTVDAIYGRKTARIAAKSRRDDPLLTVGSNLRSCTNHLRPLRPQLCDFALKNNLTKANKIKLTVLFFNNNKLNFF